MTVSSMNNDAVDEDTETSFVEGTTVQLPTFAFTTIQTTVSVPDGGTDPAGRHQANVRRSQRTRHPDAQQDSVCQPAVPERRNRPSGQQL